MSVRFESRVKEFTQSMNTFYMNELRSKAQRAVNNSRAIAPRLTGALRSEGHVEQNGSKLEAKAVFSVPYAQRRHYENRKNPQTLFYLERGGNSVAKEGLNIYD